MTRTSLSSASRSSAAVTSRITSRLSALRCAGRFRVMCAAGPSWRTSTGPAAAVSVVSSTLMPATIRLSAHDEPEARPPAVPGGVHVHEQRAVEDVVGAVARFAREVQLRREDRSVRALHLDVDVARPAGIQAGHDRPQRVAAARVGELVAAEAEALVVVLPGR